MRMLIHVVTFAGIIAVMFLIQWYSARARPYKDSQSAFVYSWPAKLFGVATVSILPLVILDITQSWQLRMCLFAVETLLIGYVVVILTTRIVLKPDSIQVSSVFRIDTFELSNISGIAISDSAQCYLLQQQGRKPLRISFYIRGAKALIGAIEQRTGVKRKNHTA